MTPLQDAYRRLLVERLEERRMLATFAWDGEGATNDWSDAANWRNATTGANTNTVLPAAGDDVVIRLDDPTESVFSRSSVTINSLQTDASLRILGGTFQIGDDASDTSIIEGALSLEAGAIAGASPLVVAGTLDWTGGAISHRDLTVEGRLAISGASGKTISFGAVTNAGREVATWEGAGITMNGGVFTNAAELVINTDAGIGTSPFQPIGTWRNLADGRITKAGEGGEQTLRVNFDNDGALIVDHGALIWNGGNSSGHEDDGAFEIHADATLGFQGGTRTLSANSKLSGDGRLELSGATVTVNTTDFAPAGPVSITGGRWIVDSAVTLSDVAFSAGSIEGSGSLTVSGAFDWTGGTISHRDLTVEGRLAISGASGKTINFGAVTNAGREPALWEGAGVAMNGGVFTNESELVINTDAGVASSPFQPAGTWRNRAGATITKAGGDGEQTLNIDLDNDGELLVESGLLRINRGLSNDGLTQIASAAVLDVGGSYAQTADAELVVAIGGSPESDSFGRLAATAVTLDGVLAVALEDGFTPELGQSFEIATFNSATGEFAEVRGLIPPEGPQLEAVLGSRSIVIGVRRDPNTFIRLNEVIGPSGTDADASDAPGAAVNLVGTASGSGPTVLAAGDPDAPTIDFNTLGGVDRTTGFDRGDLLRVLADRKHDGGPLVLDLNGNGFQDDAARTGFGMHSNRFITFDLDRIRADNGAASDQAYTLTGVAGVANTAPNNMSLLVVVDGEAAFVLDTATTDSRAFDLPIAGANRYLTFVALDGVDGDPFFAHGGFADVELLRVGDPPTSNLLANGGFETADAIGGGLPSTTADWNGDVAALVGAERGVTPFDGQRMLRFDSTAFSGGANDSTSGEVVSLIDVSTLPPGSTLSGAVRVNRVAGDTETDTGFLIDLRAYGGSIGDFPSVAFGPAELGRSIGGSLPDSDGDPTTWQTVVTDPFTLPAGTTYVAVRVAASENIFNDTSGAEFDGHYADDVTVTAVRPSTNDPEDVRTAFNAGIGGLVDVLPGWGDRFALSAIDLPVIAEDLAGLFGLGGDGGLLAGVAGSDLLTIDTPVGSIEELGDAIAALPGFAIEQLAGQPGASPSDDLLVEFTKTIPGLAATVDFDATTVGLLEGVSDTAAINGAIDVTADVTLRLLLGVDADGFFLGEESAVTVDLDFDGGLTTSYDLGFAGLDLRSVAGAGSTVDGSFAIAVGPGVGGRARLDDLTDPGTLLAATVNGAADVGLTLNVGVEGAASDLEFAAGWTLPVVDSTLGDVQQQIEYPSLDDVVAVVTPLVTRELSALFTDDWGALLQTAPLPFVSDSAAPNATAPNAAGRTWWSDFLEDAAQLPDLVSLNTVSTGVDLLGDYFAIESTLDPQLLPALFANELTPGSDLIRLAFVADATDTNAVEKSFDFGFDTGELGALGAAGVTGEVAVDVQPTANVRFGFDTDGFFVDRSSTIGGIVSGRPAATGRLNDFAVRVGGDFTLTPTATFAASADPKLRASDVPAALLSELEIDLGDLAGAATADLVIDLFDYIDVDGDPTNNTPNGGDAFVVRAVAPVTADLGSFDPTNPGAFGFDFDLSLANPDIDADGREDFTTGVLADNALELAKAVARGDRTPFQQDLSAVFDAVSGPLTDNPLGQMLGLRETLDGLIAADPPAQPGEADDDSAEGLFEVLETVELAALETLLTDPLPSPPVELARFRLNLEEVPLGFVDDTLNFKLESILPDALGVTGLAGVRDASLSGDLVFGFDTSISPLYLLSGESDLGVEFEVFVNASGQRIAGGLTLDNAELTMRPTGAIDFAGAGFDKLRIGPELTELANVGVSLTGAERLTLTADAASIALGPVEVGVIDDDPSDDAPAVRGSIDVLTGAISAELRAIVGSLGPIASFVADPAGIEPAVALDYAPAAAPTDPLLVVRGSTVTLDALASGGSAPTGSLAEFAIAHDGSIAAISPVDFSFGAGFANSIGLGGVLPFDVLGFTVTFNNQHDLSDFDLRVDGEVDFAKLRRPGDPSQPLFDARLLIDGQEVTGPFSIDIDIDGAQSGFIRPVSFGPAVIEVSDFVVPTPLGDVTLMGELQFGRLDERGVPARLLGRDDAVYGSLTAVVGNDSLPAGARLELGGVVDLFDDGSARLDATGTATFASPSGEAAAAFDLTIDATPLAAAPFVEFDIAASVQEVSLANLRWELPFGVLTAEQVSVLPNPGPDGEVAELRNLEFQLLPDGQGEPLTTFVIDSAKAFDEDAGELSLDSFLIENASALAPLVELGDGDQVFASVHNLSVAIPTLSNRGGAITGAITLAADGAAFLEDAQSVGVSVVSGALSGAVDLHGGNATLNAASIDLRIGESVLVTSSDAQLAYPFPETPTLDATLAQIGAATLSFPAYPDLPTTSLSGATVRSDGFLIDDFLIEATGARQGVAGVLDIAGLQISGTDVAVLTDAQGRFGVTGDLTLTATAAALLPDESTPTLDGPITATGLLGTLDLETGVIDLIGSEATATLPGVLTARARSETEPLPSDASQERIVTPAFAIAIDPNDTSTDAVIASFNELSLELAALPGVPPELLSAQSLVVRRDGFRLFADSGGPGVDATIDGLLDARDVAVYADVDVAFEPGVGGAPPTITPGGLIEVSATSGALVVGGFAAAVIDDDPTDNRPGLVGRVDLATTELRLTADRLFAEVGGLFELDVDDGQLTIGPNLPSTTPRFAAAEAVLNVRLFEGDTVSLTATDLRVFADGEVTIGSAEGLAEEGLAASIGLAGILPMDLTRVAVAPLAPAPTISLSSPDPSLEFVVDGFFDVTPFEAVGFTPAITIGGTQRAPGVENAFSDVTFRLEDGVLRPWQTGPIALGFASDQTLFPGFALDGELTLGGYDAGVWNPALGGQLTADLNVSGAVQSDLTVTLLPGSSLDVDAGVLTLLGRIGINAAAEGVFAGLQLEEGSFDFAFTIDVDRIAEAPFFEVTITPPMFGDLSVEEVVVDLGGLLTLTASDITLRNPVGPDGVLGEVGRIAIDAAALAGMEQTSFLVSGATLYEDRLELNDVDLELEGVVTLGGTDLVAIDDLTVLFDGVTIDFGGAAPFSGVADNPIAIADVSAFVDRINFSADAAVLLPDGEVDFDAIAEGAPPNGLATVTGLAGAFRPGAGLALFADRVAANAGPFRVEAEGAEVLLGPNFNASDDLLSVATASLTLPLLDDRSATLTAADLRVSQGGNLSITGASVSTDDPSTGFAESIGLAGVLPFDVARVELSANGDPISLNLAAPADGVSVGDLDVVVEGAFNFGLFDGLPFDPVLKIGEQSAAADADQSFELRFGITGLTTGAPAIQIKDTGPITLGVVDFSLGPFTLDTAVFTVGGYQDGLFRRDFGSDIVMSWDGQADVGLSASTVGNLFLPSDAGNPNPGAVTLAIEADLAASLALGSLATPATDEAWGFAFDDLGMRFGLLISVDDQLRLDLDDPTQMVRLEGLSAGRIAAEFGGLLTLEAEDVELDFAAFASNVAPFATFGEVGLQFGDTGAADNPLAGLGGSAGGFGVVWDPPAEGELGLPLQLVQLPDSFVNVTVPDDFRFGFPDWLPLTVSEIGLRFPDAFGDLLPNDFGDASTEPSELTRFALDALSNFSLLFSGGLQSSEAGWPIRGIVENIEVDVDALVACGQHIYDNRATYEAPIRAVIEDPGLGPLAAVGALGLELFTSGACEFPIRNLDAIDIGVEPFEIGPIEIGGGLGFGLLDIDPANTPDDPSDDSTVLFGRVEGQIAYSDIGVGVELIVTEHGPVLARLFAGVPVPIGTIVGALAGSVVPGLGTAVGASLGTQSGFILTGFQGGLVFDGEPLPVVADPLDILEDPDIRFPLDIGLEDIRDAAEGLFVDPDTNALLTTPRATWGRGFTFAASGTLTNLHVQGMIGADLALGANIGFDLQDGLSYFDGTPVTTDNLPDDLPGSASDAALGDDSPLGLQLFGFGALEVLGQGVVDTGVLFDFSNPIAPAINVAGRLPQAGSLLEMILPVEGAVGLQLRTNGVVEGALVAAKAFIERSAAGGSDVFGVALTELAARLDAERESLLAAIVLEGYAPQRPIDADFLRARLLDVFSFDFPDLPTGPDLSRAVTAAGELINAIVATSDAPLLALRDVLADAGAAASDAFFEVIDPSLSVAGSIQPVILGIPIGDLPGLPVDVPSDNIEVTLDKSAFRVTGDFGVLQKLMAISPLPLPISDRIRVDVEVPFENLLRDLALNQVPAIDPTRDWRGAFVGEVGVFGFELGQVAGIVFSEVDTLPDAIDDADGNGVPDSHPLDTQVEIFTPGVVPTRPIIVDDQATFDTLADNGGVLLDGRLSLPRFVTDPLGWANDLRGIVEQLPIDDCENLLECLTADPIGFFQTISQLPGAVTAEEIVARLQLFVPNVADELLDAFVEDPTAIDPTTQRPLSRLNQFHSALTDLLAEIAATGAVPDDAPFDLDISGLLDQLADATYLRGEYGSVPGVSSDLVAGTLFGLDLGGAVVRAEDGKLLVQTRYPGGSDITFEIDSTGDYPTAGGEARFGSFANDDPAPADALAPLLADLDLPVDVGAWLFGDGVGQRFGGAVRMYSPGFDPSAANDPIQRTGGVEVLGEVVLDNPIGQLQGDFDFRIGPGGVGGSFAGFGSITLGGLVDVPLGSPSNPLVSGTVTEEGLVVIDAGVALPAGLALLGPGTELDAAADGLLIANLSDAPVVYDAPDLPDAEDPTIEAGGGLLLVDGRLAIGETTIDGALQISSNSDGFAVFATGEVATGPLELLLGVSDLEMTVGGGFRAIGDAAIGALSFEADTALQPGASDFFESSVEFAAAFNTSGAATAIGVADFVSSGLPAELAEPISVPANTTRFIAAGAYRVLGVGFDDAVFIAQAGPGRIDVSVEGDLDLGYLGEVDSSGDFSISTAGAAGRFAIDGEVAVADPLLGVDLVRLRGDAAVEFNTSANTVSLALDDADLTLLDAVKLEGDADVSLFGSGFELDARLAFSVDPPDLVPGLPDTIDAVAANVSLTVGPDGLDEAEFALGFFPAGSPLATISNATAQLYRNGCLLFDAPGLPPLLDPRFNVVPGRTCQTTLYVDDVVTIEADAIKTATVPIRISPPPVFSTDIALSFVDGSAEKGRDYEIVSEAVTFAPGQDEALVPFQVLARAGDNGVRSFSISVTDATPAVAIADGVGIITIQEDDVPPVGPAVAVSVTPVGALNAQSESGGRLEASIDEDAGAATLRFAAPQLLDGDALRIRYEVVAAGGAPSETARLNDDYRLAGGSLFGGEVTLFGSTPVEIDLSILDDDLPELPETFELRLSVLDAARFAPTTSLLTDEVAITIDSDDPEIPADAVAFFDFNGVYVGSPLGGFYAGTRAPAVPAVDDPDLVVSPLGHSAGTPPLSEGLPTLDPNRSFDPMSPAVASAEWVGDGGLSGDLLENGGGESGLNGWTPINSLWRGRSVSSPAPREGFDLLQPGFIADGDAKGVTQLTQTVDIRPFTTAIDAGRQEFEFSAFVRQGASIFNPDVGRLVIDFRNARGATIASFESPDVTSRTAWERVALRETAPVGARSVRVRLVAEKAESPFGTIGTPRVYFDDAQLRAVLPPYYAFTIRVNDDPTLPLASQQDYQQATALWLTGVDFWNQSARGGPTHWELRTSADGFTAAIASGTTSAGAFDHERRIAFAEPLAGLHPILEPIEVRLYAYGADEGAWAIDNLALLGEVGSLADVPAPPVAVDDFRQVLNNGASGYTVSNVTGNDFDPNGGRRVIASYTQPDHGSVARLGASGFVYFGDPGFAGEDRFDYTIRVDGEYATATVTLDVVAFPTAEDDAYPVIAGVPLSVSTTNGLLSNDNLGVFDPSQVSLSLVGPINTTANPGAFALDNDGSFTFTPSAGVTGTFVYRYVAQTNDPTLETAAFEGFVTITVAPDASRQAIGESYDTDEDTTLSVGSASATVVGVLANDLPGVSGIPLEAVLVSGSQHGQLTLRPNGSFVYTPNANSHVNDSFQYRIGTHPTDPIATATIRVDPVNDSPTAFSFTRPISVGSTGPVTIDVVAANLEALAPGQTLDLETAASNLQVQVVQRARFGNVYLDSFDLGRVVYYPPSGGFQQQDSFTYRLYDRGDPDNAPFGDRAPNYSQTVTVTLNPFDPFATRIVIRTFAFNSYLDSATTFLDVNNNGVADTVELPDPTTGAPTPFAEPVATTQADGGVRFVIDPVFDRDADGRIAADEGTLVISGGVLTNTGASLPTLLRAPGLDSIASPLSTLLWNMVNAFGVDYDQAQSAAREALALPDVGLLTFHSLNAVAAGEAFGPSVYAASVALQNATVQAGAYLSAATGAGFQQAVDVVLVELGRSALLGQPLPLGDARLWRGVLTRASEALGGVGESESIDAAARVIAASAAAIDRLNGGADLALLESLARIEGAAQGVVAQRLADLAAGNATADAVLTETTGQVLEQLVAASPVGTVTPVRALAADTSVDLDSGANEVAFEVRLNQQSTRSIVVGYATRDGDALAGVDYEAVSGEMTFAPGETRKTVRIPLLPTNGGGILQSFDLLLTPREGAVVFDEIATATLVGGDDTDGVSAIVEAAAPNGGDGDNDRVGDWRQSHVASLPAGASANYLTIAGPANARLIDAQTTPAPLSPLNGAVAPVGEIRLTALAAEAGAELTVYFAEPLELDTWFLFDAAADGWFATEAEFADADSDGLVESVRFRVDDAGPADLDGHANGAITIRALPALDDKVIGVTEITIGPGPTQRSIVDQITVEFDEPTNLEALIASGQIIDAVRLVNLGVVADTDNDTPAALTAAQFGYDEDQSTGQSRLVWSLDPLADVGDSLEDGAYRFSIDGSLILGQSRAPLDGAGALVPGSDLVFEFHRLQGDANGDRIVDALDAQLVDAALGSDPTTERWNADADLDGDRRITVRDRLIAFENAGRQVVPSGAAAAVPLLLPGDFNGDGVVNAADYSVWRDHLGVTGASPRQGDANGDRIVNALDRDLWAQGYGSRLETPSASFVDASEELTAAVNESIPTAAPEPIFTPVLSNTNRDSDSEASQRDDTVDSAKPSTNNNSKRLLLHSDRSTRETDDDEADRVQLRTDGDDAPASAQPSRDHVDAAFEKLGAASWKNLKALGE